MGNTLNNTHTQAKGNTQTMKQAKEQGTNAVANECVGSYHGAEANVGGESNIGIDLKLGAMCVVTVVSGVAL